MPQDTFSEANSRKILPHRRLHFLSQHTTPGPLWVSDNTTPDRKQKFQWAFGTLGLILGDDKLSFSHLPEALAHVVVVQPTEVESEGE